MKVKSTLVPAEYQFFLVRKLLLVWSILPIVAIFFHSHWYTFNFSSTMLMNSFVAIVPVSALVCRKVLTTENRQRVVAYFSVISTVSLSAVTIFVNESNLQNVAIGLLLHSLAVSLIVRPTTILRVGIGTSVLYLLTLCIRELHRGDLFASELMGAQVIARAVFPFFYFITASVIMRSQVGTLNRALIRVNELEKILPICSYCRRICDSSGNWATIEDYINSETDTRFSHGICPECYTKAKSDLE